MANLAWAYEFGVGTRPQPEKAADLYRRALERNENIPVYGYLGELYALGMGADRDLSQALDLYRMGAERGDCLACLNLGLLFQRGEGVRKNPGKALKLFDQAGAAGYAAMARCYRLGIGVKQDERTAAEWYRKDAEEGGWTGMLWLAWMYRKGLGVEKDRSAAEELCRQAAAMNRRDREFLPRRMGSAGQELKKLLRDLERGTEDEELREELRGIRLRLEEERQRQ